jgi:hypothetical protein
VKSAAAHGDMGSPFKVQQPAVFVLTGVVAPLPWSRHRRHSIAE